ncbi:MAG: hypothetical protein NZ108_01380, partial [Bacteroidia bacterium]|nr:hypothetical protein [Bacteroidia bacterium]
MRTFLIKLVCLFSILWGYAYSQTVHISPNSEVIYFGNQLSIWQDPSHRVPLDTVIQHPEWFRLNQNLLVNFDISPDAVWIRFQVQATETGVYDLRLLPQAFENADLWIETEGKWKYYHQSRNRGLELNRNASGVFFPLSLTANYPHTIYARFTARIPFHFMPAIASQSKLMEAQTKHDLLNGAFIGFVVLLLIQ